VSTGTDIHWVTPLRSDRAVLHPALFDASLHAVLVGGSDQE
jgi:hypothetical protein